MTTTLGRPILKKSILPTNKTSFILLITLFKKKDGVLKIQALSK